MADETNTVLKHFQIFRNKEIGTYGTYAIALATAKAEWNSDFVEAKGLNDGEFVLFNYRLEQATKVESILGIVRGGAIDIIGSYDQLTTEYKAYVDSAINALDADKSGSNTKGDITVQVVETDGKITEVKVSDTLKSVAHTGAAADVEIVDEDGLYTSTTVEAALAEVMAKANTLDAAQLSAGTGIEIGTDNTINANFDIAIETRTGENAGEYIVIKDGENVIADVNANAFIKDGFLASVTKDATTNELVFTWNTDAEAGESNQVTRIAISDLCDVYTAKVNDWIQLNGFEFSHKTSSVTAGTYANNTDNVTVDSTTEKSFNVPTLTVDAAGHVTAASEKTVTIKLPATIDTAIQGGAGVNTTYIQTTVDRNSTNTNQLDVTSTAVIGDYAAEGQKDGLATTTTTKAYVDGKIATVNTAIEALDVNPFSLTTLNSDKLEGYQISEVDGKIVKGQTAETLLTFASAPTTDNKVATQAEIAALDADVTSTTGTNVQVQVTEVDGKITAVNVVNDVTASKSALDTEIARAKAAEEANTTAIAIERGRIDAMDLTATPIVSLNGTTLKQSHISQTDGKVSVETVETALLTFASAPTAENKVATITEVNAAKEATTYDAGTGISISDDNVISTTVTLNYDSNKKTIQLLDNANGTAIGTIDATDFIKDGMLADAEIITAPVSGEDTLEDGHRYIKFTFKTYQYGVEGEEVLKVEYLDVENLFDSYTSGNEWIDIDQTANTISHKTITGLDSTNAHGITEAVTVNSTDTKTFQVPTLKVDAAGHVVSVDEKTVTITLPAYIDTAVQTVTAAQTEVLSNTKFVAVNAIRAQNSNDVVLTSEVKTQAVATATAAEGETPAVDGLATALDVKSYVDTKVGEANTAITNAIAKLDATVTDSNEKNDITVKVTQTDGILTAVEVTDSLAEVAHSGAAADVTYTRGSGDNVTNMTVQAAISALEAVDTWDAGTY
jgi:hypothetical protein